MPGRCCCDGGEAPTTICDALTIPTTGLVVTKTTAPAPSDPAIYCGGYPQSAPAVYRQDRTLYRATSTNRYSAILTSDDYWVTSPYWCVESTTGAWSNEVFAFRCGVTSLESWYLRSPASNALGCGACVWGTDTFQAPNDCYVEEIRASTGLPVAVAPSDYLIPAGEPTVVSTSPIHLRYRHFPVPGFPSVYTQFDVTET